MWSIARVDYTSISNTEIEFLDTPGLFTLVSAYQMKDLPTFAEIRQESGFVGPDDDLVLLRPDGTVKAINEAEKVLEVARQ